MARRNRRAYSAAEKAEYRAAKREERRERLEQAVSELASSEGWRRWVESRSLFHRYSFGNTLLILGQRPDATLVASYNTWKRAGRQVRRGEHGIAINVPMTVKVGKRDESAHEGGTLSSPAVTLRRLEDTSGERDDRATRVVFKTGHVFDVSQTDGEKLPTLAREPIAGDSHAGYLPQLEAFAGTLGYRVEYRDLSDRAAGGWCDSKAQLMVVDSSAPANGRVRTLVHELAHALGVGYADYGRELAEVIVESAAVIVCGTVGLDTSGESVPYVAGWADGDAAKIREYAEKVDECARRIEDALDIDEMGMWSE
jgi:antirestriction protein ArdC